MKRGRVRGVEVGREEGRVEVGREEGGGGVEVGREKGRVEVGEEEGEGVRRPVGREEGERWKKEGKSGGWGWGRVGCRGEVL